MANRWSGLFKSKAAPRDTTTMVFTGGNQLIFDSPAARSAQAIDAAIMRAFSGQASLDPETLSNAVAVSAAVFRFLEYRANVISQIPLYASLSTGDRVDEYSPFRFFLSIAPQLLSNISRSLDIWGYSYLKKVRNPSRYPTGLMWLNPVNVREMGQPQITHYEIFDEDTWVYSTVPVDEVIVMRRFDSRRLGSGISLIEASYRLIGLDFGSVTHALSFLTNSARIDGMLTFDKEMNPKQLDDAREQWRIFKGPANAHKTAVMPHGARWTPVQATPKDIMMSDTKRDLRTDLSAIWGVDLGLVGLEGVADPLSANSTYSSKEVSFVRTEALPLVKQTVLPALNTDWAKRDFELAYELKADESKIPALAESHLAKAQMANEVRTSGLYTHDEARALVGMEPEDDYLKRAPDEPLKVWERGGVTLNLFHEYTFGRRLLPKHLQEQGEVVLLNGVLIPVNRILEFANANVDRMKAPFPFIGAPSPQDVTVTTPPALTLPDGERDTGDSLFVGLDLSNNVDLIGLQRQLRERYPAVSWNDPADFHVTLLYAPICDPAKAKAFGDALRFIDVPEMTLRIGSLKSFDSIGEHAIHFRVRENADLRDFQDTVYALAQDCGIEASSYSLPGQWIPHVTMGYAPEKQTVYWSSKLAVTPRGLLCEHGDKPLLEPPPLLGAPELPIRGTNSLDVAILFTGNNHIKAARRELSAFLTERGYKNPQWLPEAAWRVELLSFDQWSPSLLSRFIRETDYANVRPPDLETTGYMERDGRIYLAIQPSDALEGIINSLALDMEAVGMTPIQPPLRGILLCEVDELVDLSGAPLAHYPLFGDNITTLKNGVEPVHMWALRNLSRAQELDLDRWGRVARRKGRTEPFAALTLPPIVSAFVALSLEDPEADAETVFADAKEFLRTYRDTRISYQQEIRAAIERARADEVTARKFDGEMNSIVRRYGLQTVYDAYDDAGSPIESLSQDDLTMFRAWQVETKDYIRNFKNELFREGGISLAEVDVRVALWANKTLDDIYYTMLRQAAPQLEVTWYRDPVAESCTDCLERDGKPFTLDQLGKIGFPRDRRLACGGWQCACLVRDAKGKAYRSRYADDAPILRSIAVLGLDEFTRRYHVHEDNHVHEQ